MSSYIAFELKALEDAAHIGRAAGVSEDTIIAGMARMWAWAWRSKSAIVQPLHVRGFFGSDVADALTAFGFLAPCDDGLRIRGADRYLRIAEARAEGGKKAVGNLKRGTERPGSSPAPAGTKPEVAPGSRNSPESPEMDPSAEPLEPGTLPGSSPAPAGNQPGNAPGSAPALTPSTEHRDLKNVRTYERTHRLPIVDEPARPPLQHIEAPDTPPETWGADEFWRWYQAERVDGVDGLPQERPPHPRKLSTWWAEARGQCTVEQLQEAAHRFGGERYWCSQTPPIPFAGFMSQWDRYVQPLGVRHVG